MIRVRTMRNSEVDTILSLRRMYFGDFFESRFRRYITKNPTAIVVAKDDEEDKILGYAFAYPWRTNVGVIHHMYASDVLQSEVEQGILDHLERFFIKKNFHSIRIWVLEEQKGIIEYLKRSCFELDTELLVFENHKISADSYINSGTKAVTIQKFKEDYIEDVMNIEVDCFKPSWQLSRNDFLSFAKRKDSWFPVATMDERAVGLLQISSSGELGYLGRLAVLSGSQGDGVGTRLVSEAMTWFEKRGVTKVKLRSPAENTSAHRLYIKFGFKQIGREFDYIKKLDIQDQD